MSTIAGIPFGRPPRSINASVSAPPSGRRGDNGQMTAHETRPLAIIDAANVVGSRPDGWWRDRRAANERLRDALESLSERGFGDISPPLRVILVVEGQAAGIAATPTVEVVTARGSGDDRIVELVAAQTDHATWVVTADRELRARVQSLGAQTIGPGSLRDQRNS